MGFFEDGHSIIINNIWPETKLASSGVGLELNLHVVSLDQTSLSDVGLYAGRLGSFSSTAVRRIGFPSQKPIVICFLSQRLRRQVVLSFNYSPN